MNTVKIVRYEKGMKVEYPCLPYVGQANVKGIWVDKDRIGRGSKCPEGFDVEGMELISMQEYYLRGKVMYKDEWYVFTAVVDLRYFDNDDYQQLINNVCAEIKKEN